ISEDSGTNLTGTSTADSLVLASTGAITNMATADVTVTNNAAFSGTSITLGTTTGDAMNFGTLTFNSAGAVSISEDSGSSLTGTSTADSLLLVSAGAISETG